MRQRCWRERIAWVVKEEVLVVGSDIVEGIRGIWPAI